MIIPIPVDPSATYDPVWTAIVVGTIIIMVFIMSKVVNDDSIFTSEKELDK